MELLTKALLDLATVALTILIPILVGFAVEWLRKKVGAQNIENIKEQLYLKQELAEAAVKFVQQVWTNADGSRKYHEAAVWLSLRAAEIGLVLSANEIKGLIEAAVKDGKWRFSEAWKK